MTDLKQLSSDAFNSALRRLPYINVSFNPGNQIQKIFEEVEELEDAYLNGGASAHCPELTSKEEEVADVIISCLVFAKIENIDIDKALRVKNEYNKTRV